jgi:hypothetical protein
MARSLAGEVRRVNTNLLWCNVLLLLAALGVAVLPTIWGIGVSEASIVLWCCAVPPAGVSLWNLAKWLKRSGEPESHPFFEKIRGLGFGVEDAVERDLEQAKDFLRLTLGASWLLRRGFFKLELVPLTDAVWAFQRDHNGGYVFYSQAVVQLRDGKSLGSDMTTSSKKVAEFLEILSQNAPWIILGENDALSKLWKKDREDFVAQVDQRRSVLETLKKHSRP